MKLDYCKEHQGSDRTDLTCRRIRNDDGTPATQEEIWTQLERMALAPDHEVRATMSLCCGSVRAGWHPESVMHSGDCRRLHGGELGPTYYLQDSGLVMDACGVMRNRPEQLIGGEEDEGN